MVRSLSHANPVLYANALPAMNGLDDLRGK